MLSFFRNIKKKPQTKNSSFYLRENLIQNIDDLKIIFLKTSNQTSNTPILYQGLALDSININELEDHFGDEAFVIDENENLPGHTVYFYRNNVDSFNILTQLHFLNKVFLFASTKVSSESLLTLKQKKTVLDQLLKRFPDVKVPENSFDFDFKDRQGNVVYTSDNVFMYINYCANNPQIEQLKQTAEKTIFQPKPKDEEEDSLDKFI